MAKTLCVKPAKLSTARASRQTSCLQVIGEYDAMIVRGRTKVTAAVFEAAPNMKVVGRAGVGVDNIDLNAAKQHNVVVVNSPNATTVAVAELTMGLMLALVREIPRADPAMKNGKWLKKDLEGAELYEKTLGIIGYGRIGQALPSAPLPSICGLWPLIRCARRKMSANRLRAADPGRRC
jgi:phosphoglycerate dehydrogenase-like enzyme